MSAEDSGTPTGTYHGRPLASASNGHGIFADNPAWMDDGICASIDPELWFPEKGGPVSEAKTICRSCPVQDACLEYAINTTQRFGVWGGYSERERRNLSKGRTA